jgi:hypothetical protein
MNNALNVPNIPVNNANNNMIDTPTTSQHYSSILNNPFINQIRTPILENTNSTTSSTALGDDTSLTSSVIPGTNIIASPSSAVTVDFLMTTALSPLIPGGEYYIDDDGIISNTGGTLIGTALDSQRLLLLSTINRCVKS